MIQPCSTTSPERLPTTASSLHLLRCPCWPSWPPIFRRSRTPPQPVRGRTFALPATRPFVPQLTLALPGPYSGIPIALPADWSVSAASTSTSDPAHTALTNLNILHAVYGSLRTPVSRREWESLGTGSSIQRRVAEAYKLRCEALGRQKAWDAGVKCGRALLLGVEVQADGQCELVFAKPSEYFR